MSLRKPFLYTFAIALGLLCATGVLAWTGPSLGFPGGNASAPLNVSGTGQIKSGVLTVGGLSAPVFCIGVSCISSWAAAGGSQWTTSGSSVYYSGGAGVGVPGNFQVLTGGVSPTLNRIAFGTDGTGYHFAISKNQAGTISDLLTVQDNGNVGIGNSAPLNLLSIGSSLGNAGQSFYSLGVKSVGVLNSLYSYGYICAGNASGDCTGAGGVVLNGTNGSITASGSITSGTVAATGYTAVSNTAGMLIGTYPGQSPAYGFIQAPSGSSVHIWDSTTNDIATFNTSGLTMAAGKSITAGAITASGSITSGGKLVCLADGTNCPAGAAPAWASITGKPYAFNQSTDSGASPTFGTITANAQLNNWAGIFNPNGAYGITVAANSSGISVQLANFGSGLTTNGTGSFGGNVTAGSFTTSGAINATGAITSGGTITGSNICTTGGKCLSTQGGTFGGGWGKYTTGTQGCPEPNGLAGGTCGCTIGTAHGLGSGTDSGSPINMYLCY